MNYTFILPHKHHAQKNTPLLQPMLRIVNPLAWTKIWFLAASHFCKPRVSIYVCHMVYFASLRHIDKPRCIARYFALIHVLQNLHEPSASNSSCDNKQPIFAQIYKQWLFLSSTAHSRSLYFAAAYRLAIIRLTCKNQKWDTFQQATTNVHEKAKIKKYPNSKNRQAEQWSHFYHAATAPRIMLLAAIFCDNTLKPNA